MPLDSSTFSHQVQPQGSHRVVGFSQGPQHATAVTSGPHTVFAEVMPGTDPQSRHVVPTGMQGDLPSQMPQSVGELWSLCQRYWRISSAAGLVVVAAVLLSGVRVTPLYMSEASLELYSSPKAVSFQQPGSDDLNGYFDISRVNTQRERLLSTPVLERTLATSDLGLGPAFRKSSDPVDTLRNRLTVTVNKDNYVFNVSLMDEDRLRAQRGLKSVLDAYFAEQDDRAGSHANSSLAFLQKQVETARRSVDAAREEEEAYKREHGILSTDPEENLHSRTLRELTSKRSDLDQHRVAIAALVGEVQSATTVNDVAMRREELLRIDPIGSNTLVQKQQEQLFQAQADAQKLAPRFGPKHPRMKEAQLAIEARQNELDQAIDIARQDILTTDIQLGQEQTSLDKLIRVESQALDSYRANLNRLQALTQSTKAASDMLDDLMRREREEDVVARLDAKQVVEINKPAPATGPVNIHVFRMLCVALTLGAMAAVGAALMKELLERSLIGLGRARELTGLPLLGTVPAMGHLAPLGGGDPEREPSIAAAFRALRENLILTGNRVQTGRCIMVTSPSPEEGKTSITARLAVAYAAAGARVLLVDVDMRRPSQPREMGVDARSGLTAMLARSEQVAPVSTPYKNLDFLAVGEAPTNPSELLYSPHMSDWLLQARQHYDIILCDSSPLLVTDPLILGEQCDGIILVLRDRHTPKKAIHEALLSLQPLRDRLLGFVLNDAHEDKERRRYDYYYVSKALPDPRKPHPAAVA